MDPGILDQVDHTLIMYGTIQIIQFSSRKFLLSYHDLSGIIYVPEYDQPGTIKPS